jgi:DNA-binding protein YbaB
MAGVGKLLKQAQKMQRSIETLQTQMEVKEIEVTAGGGAIKIKITATGKFLSLVLDPEFLKEDSKLISDIKKTCYEIKFTPPTIDQFLVLINKICQKENINIIDQNVSLNIISNYINRD